MEREPWGADTAEPWIPEPVQTEADDPYEHATVRDVIADLQAILEYVDGDFGADGVQIVHMKQDGYVDGKPDRLVILLTNGEEVELRAEIVTSDSRISEN